MAVSFFSLVSIRFLTDAPLRQNTFQGHHLHEGRNYFSFLSWPFKENHQFDKIRQDLAPYQGRERKEMNNGSSSRLFQLRLKPATLDVFLSSYQ